MALATGACVPNPTSMNRFLLLHAALPALAFGVVATLLEQTHVDLALASGFWDALQQRWTWGESWWTNEFLHVGGVRLMLAIGLSVLGVFLASYRVKRLRRHRRAAFFVALCLATGPLLVSQAQGITNVECPRQLVRFGGKHPYVRLFEPKPADAHRGHCFPAAHASGAYALVACYFGLRERWLRAARVALGAALMLGAVFSAGQWARGAHFLSHDLWSLAICWFVALAYYAGAFERELYPGTARPPVQRAAL